MNQYLEMIGQEHLDRDRPNRMCVSLSDIHLTDGTVGYQNLGQYTWNLFLTDLIAKCKRYFITELKLVLDGDIIDMIRSSRWAENGIYPWERDNPKFNEIIYDITRDIIDNKHKEFFQWLRQFPGEMEKIDVEAKIVMIIGNHDKELFMDSKSLTYFYEVGLGRKLSSFTKEEREALGRMYGNEKKFLDPTIPPYLPFYYGDRGFRFFTTHGQWRDKLNSREIKAVKGKPGWSVSKGWNIDTWKQLEFSPFFEPCFGDTVAAGVLSTFIYKTKKDLDTAGIKDDRLNRVLDELDLYRPSYKAVERILDEAQSMRKRGYQEKIIAIIEDNIYACIIDWLSWDFTYQSSPFWQKVFLHLIKFVLKFLHKCGLGLEMMTIKWAARLLGGLAKDKLKFKNIKTFPAFLPAYQHYGFQVHGEGHTHHALEEEVKIQGEKHPSSYINFGTWRDQIVGRMPTGYRRRSILRVFYILDLKEIINDEYTGRRTFNHYTADILHWSDKADNFSEKGKNLIHT